MNNAPKNVLVIRFSSFGDVLLTLPILEQAILENPSINFYVLTKKSFKNIFEHLPRTKVIGIDFKEQYKGFLGILQLFFYLKKNYPIDAVADLHAVLRTNILRFCYSITRTPFFVIKKNRNSKRYFLQKKIHELPSVWQLYSKALKELNIIIDLNKFKRLVFDIPATNRSQLMQNKLLEHRLPIIAIAPFASHKSKIYPLEKTEHIVEQLTYKKSAKVLLLGNGEEEINIMLAWQKKYNNIYTIYEFTIMEQLHVLQICNKAFVMDSANMHLSGLADIKIIVIPWGSTSPDSGFVMWKNVVNINNKISCQPCSIYGNKPCHRGDHLCMNSISTNQILQVLKQF